MKSVIKRSDREAEIVLLYYDRKKQHQPDMCRDDEGKKFNKKKVKNDYIFK